MKSKSKSKAKIVRYKSKGKKKGNAVYNKPGYVYMGLGFPKKIQMTHKYVQGVTFNTPLGALAANNFRANGMFDPDQSGVGGQPLYFDQLTALYDHYVIIGSKITVKFIPSTTGNTSPFYAMILLNDDTSLAVTNIVYAMEQSQARRARLITTNANKPVEITCNFSAKKIFGGQTMSNPRLEGTSGADPTEQSYFQILIQPIDGITNISCFAHVEISYIAVWKELKDVLQS